MPALNPRLEALAMLREMLTELESRIAAEQSESEQHSADEREDRELAADWAARHRARLRGPRRPAAKRNVRQQRHSAARRA